MHSARRGPITVRDVKKRLRDLPDDAIVIGFFSDDEGDVARMAVDLPDTMYLVKSKKKRLQRGQILKPNNVYATLDDVGEIDSDKEIIEVVSLT